jgi:hypothetical protein
MKQFTDARDKERRAQKIVEKQNLERRKLIKDKRYHEITDYEDEDALIEQEYEHFIKGKKS